MTVASFFLSLIVIFSAAKLFGELAERIGQPAVLGEMIGGIVIGVSGLRWIDPRAPVLHLLAELGVVLLLFLIGLETDLRQLLASGGSATSVALTGMALPLVGGFGAASLLHYPTPVQSFSVQLSLRPPSGSPRGFSLISVTCARTSRRSSLVPR